MNLSSSFLIVVHLFWFLRAVLENQHLLVSESEDELKL